MRRRVAGTKNIRTLADAFKSAQHNLLKLKRYEGLNYDSNDEENPEEGTEEINVIQGRVPLGVEVAQQIVDLPISELQTTTENDKGANPTDQNVKKKLFILGDMLKLQKVRT